VLLDASDAGADLGKAFPTERVFKGLAADEDVTPKKTAAHLWAQIGPRTKAVLYNAGAGWQYRNIDDFPSLGGRSQEQIAKMLCGYM